MKSNGTTLQVEQLYREYKPLLASIAYRMLGSMSEAEDVVQDVFAAISKLKGIDISHPKAYLVKMITNRTLNVMKSSPRKREQYPGQWLPEPVIELCSDDEPQERVLRREQLGYALLVLLQTCTPPERAVFVLRESLGYDYADIAVILEKSEPACRKIYSRAAAKISQRPRNQNEVTLDASMDHFVNSFGQAIDTGRFESFIHLLTDDAVLLSDGGGLVRAALNPIEGRNRIAAFLQGIAAKGSLTGQLRRVWISGQHGLLLLRKDKPPLVLTLEPEEDLGAIRAIYYVSNPEKLTLPT